MSKWLMRDDVMNITIRILADALGFITGLVLVCTYWILTSN